MFIELTDHLRCPADHEESYLVLLPDRMEERSVREGRLGCPVCGRTYTLADGILDLGGDVPEPPATTLLEPEPPDDRPSAHWYYLPALLLAALVWWAQGRRMRRDPSLPQGAPSLNAS